MIIIKLLLQYISQRYENLLTYTPKLKKIIIFQNKKKANIKQMQKHTKFLSGDR